MNVSKLIVGLVAAAIAGFSFAQPSTGPGMALSGKGPGMGMDGGLPAGGKVVKKVAKKRVKQHVKTHAASEHPEAAAAIEEHRASKSAAGGNGLRPRMGASAAQ